MERLRSRRKDRKHDSSRNGSRRLKYEFVQLDAPEHLNLQFENVELVLKLVANIKKLASKGYYIELNLDRVTEIGEGAIAMLLSVISDLERKGIFFKGARPIHPIPNDILEKSGFFKHMNGTVSGKNIISRNKILKTGNQLTHQHNITPEIHEAMETVWGEKARCPALYGGIGEMVRNSCDHAFPEQSKIIWHLGISHFEAENCCKFSFVDNGLGIIETYGEKGVLTKVKQFFTDNCDFLLSAFKNGIQSRTGLSWRGKGLPTIYEMFEDGIICNLVVISNDVYLDFERGIFSKLEHPFSGTYYFWKVNNSCEPLHFKLND